MIVIPGPASPNLGELVAKNLSLESHPADHRIFPDGESYIRLTAPVDGQDVIIVQTTTPQQDTRLIQLLLMVDTARKLGANNIFCVVPYLAYSRQDKRFIKGEALSLNLIIELLDKTGTDELIVIDIHNEASLEKAQKNCSMKIVNLSAIPLTASYLGSIGYKNAYSLSPDKGATHLVEAAAEVLGGRHGYFEKSRDRKTGKIDMKVKDVDISDEKAVVFDDIISSGSTMAEAVAGLKFQGATKVAAACTHGLFIGGAEKKITAAGADILLATDTIETSFSQVSVAPLIARYFKKLDLRL